MWQIDCWPDVHFFPRSVSQLLTLADPSNYHFLLLEWPYEDKDWLAIDPWKGDQSLPAATQRELAIRYGTTSYFHDLVESFDGRTLFIDSMALRQSNPHSVETVYYQRDRFMASFIERLIRVNPRPTRALLVAGILHVAVLLQMLSTAQMRCARDFKEAKDDFVAMLHDTLTTQAYQAAFSADQFKRLRWYHTLYDNATNFQELRQVEIGIALLEAGIPVDRIDQTLVGLNRYYGLV